jgi:hypothetical protein
VHEKEVNWQNIVMGRDEEKVCTKAKIFEILQSAAVPTNWLALTAMKNWMWHDCSKAAIYPLNSLCLDQATFFKTIANWNKVLWKFKCFPHPNPCMYNVESDRFP